MATADVIHVDEEIDLSAQQQLVGWFDQLAVTVGHVEFVSYPTVFEPDTPTIDGRDER